MSVFLYKKQCFVHKMSWVFRGECERCITAEQSIFLQNRYYFKRFVFFLKNLPVTRRGQSPNRPVLNISNVCKIDCFCKNWWEIMCVMVYWVQFPSFRGTMWASSPTIYSNHIVRWNLFCGNSAFTGRCGLCHLRRSVSVVPLGAGTKITAVSQLRRSVTRLFLLLRVLFRLWVFSLSSSGKRQGLLLPISP